jgi:hypothetical protein
MRLTCSNHTSQMIPNVDTRRLWPCSPDRSLEAPWQPAPFRITKPPCTHTVATVALLLILRTLQTTRARN